MISTRFCLLISKKRQFGLAVYLLIQSERNLKLTFRKQRADMAALRRMLSSVVRGDGLSLGSKAQLEKIDPDFEQILEGLSGLSAPPPRILPPQKIKKGLSNADRWVEHLQDLASVFPNAVSRLTVKASSRFVFDKVLNEKVITGRFQGDGVEFPIYVRGDSRRPPAGCGCNNSDGQYPCEHGYHFVQWLIKEIKSFQSTLATKLNTNQFDAGKFVLSSFKYDTSQKLISMMDDLLKRAPSESESTEFTLPTSVIEVDSSRIAWELDLSFRSRFIRCFSNLASVVVAGPRVAGLR